MSREDDVAKSLNEMRSALASIVASGDCTYADFPDEPPTPTPCLCATCLARDVLSREQGRDWRYEGASAYRAQNGYNPRETRMVGAFREQIGDVRLGQILCRGQNTERTGYAYVAPSAEVTPRDWFVAVTVVQWLATNVGMDILAKAGWEYTMWAEDKAKGKKT